MAVEVASLRLGRCSGASESLGLTTVIGGGSSSTGMRCTA